MNGGLKNLEDDPIPKKQLDTVWYLGKLCFTSYMYIHNNYVKILKMCGKTLAGFAPTIARVRDSNTNQQTMRDTHTHSGQLFFRGSGYISIWTYMSRLLLFRLTVEQADSWGSVYI